MGDLVVTLLDVRPLPGCNFRQFTLGESASLGDSVYMKSDGKVWKSDSDAAGTSYAIGVIVSINTFGATTGVAGDRVAVALSGPVAGFTCTAGARGFVSGTAGKISTDSGSTDVCMGVGLPDNIFFLSPALMPAGGVAVGAGAVDTAELADGAVTAAKLEDGAAADGITGDKIQFSANADTLGVPVLLFRLNQAAGANGNTDITWAQKIRVLDFWAVLTGAGVASSVCTLKSTAAAISDGLDTSGADKAVVRAASIDDANHEIASGGVLRITGSGGATQPALTAYVLAVPVA
jgi:hypothetical protein